MRMYAKLRWLIFNNVPKIFFDKNHFLKRRGFEKTVGEWNIDEHEHLIKINDNKVDHPRLGGKDFADTDMLLSNLLVNLETSLS